MTQMLKTVMCYLCKTCSTAASNNMKVKPVTESIIMTKIRYQDIKYWTTTYTECSIFTRF